MKYLMISLIALPLLASCNTFEEDYYPHGNYYNPTPRVEVNPHYHSHDQSNQHYHNPNQYRAAPTVNNYHGHINNGGNVAPVNHSHVQVPQTVHGHLQNKSNVAIHPNTQSTQAQSQQKVHGHGDNNMGTHQEVNPAQSSEGHTNDHGSAHGHN